jgi:hypothetical protein
MTLGMILSPYNAEIAANETIVELADTIVKRSNLRPSWLFDQERSERRRVSTLKTLLSPLRRTR